MPIRFDPLRELDRLARSLGQLFERPAALQVNRTEGEVRLDVDLPGVRADDIELTVDAERVVVRAVRRADTADAAGTDRELQHEHDLTDPVDLDRVSADYEDGVLRVHLPLVGGSQARRVPVRQPTSGSAGTRAPAPPPGSAAEEERSGAASATTPPPAGEQANPLPTS